MFNVLKKIYRAVLKIFAKALKLKNYHKIITRMILEKHCRSRDREHQFQQNFLGVK